MTIRNEASGRIACVLAAVLIALPPTAAVPFTSGTLRYSALTRSDEIPLVGAGTPLPIVLGATWAYFKGTVEPPAAWNTVAFDDGSWLTGPSGFGYGDGDDATVLSDMQNGYLSVYTRRQFDVPDAGAVAGLELTVNWDDGFVAFINGQEVARRNLAGATGTPVAHDIAASSHEAGTPETIPVSAAVLVDGTNVLAVQGHNTRLDSSDLTLAVQLRAINPPPAVPTSPSPADGAIGVSINPDLCVTVSDPNDATLDVTFYGREVSFPTADPFTIIALPDTQYYSQDHPEIYTAQTQWIVDNLAARNIAFVTQLGDCVNVGATEAQWINADAAWDLVESPLTTGLTFGIPYGIAVGNHDQNPIGDPGTIDNEGSTTPLYNTYFGISRFTGRGYYGGHYGINNDDHYELFEAGGMEFIAIHFEYMPSDTPLRQAVLDWADTVLKAYPNRRAILTAHYFLNPGNASWSNQGQATWDALKDNHNLFLMLCGHLDQANHRYDEYTDASGTTRAHTMVSDFQTRSPGGGNGWLRILTFDPQDDTIHVETYSPTIEGGRFINEPTRHADDLPNATPSASDPTAPCYWNAGAGHSTNGSCNELVLPYDMAGGAPFAVVASASGPSGSQVCAPWHGRNGLTTYEWYATVSDGTSSTAGAHATFTTGPATCSVPAECDDGNACTTDDCIDGICQFVPVANCCLSPADCDDGDVCTDDTCDDGTCGHANNTVPCDDGDGCTVGDTCAAGVCAGVPNTCDDGNACTADSCSAGACVNAYAPYAGCCTSSDDCDDGVLCSADSCRDGSCVNTPDGNCCDTGAQCDDGEICTTDICASNNPSGLSLSGGSSSYVTMGTAPALGLAQFTIEAWFNRSAPGVSNTTGSMGITVVPLVAKGAPEADGSNVDANYILGINTSGNVLAADFEDSATGLNHPVSGSTPIVEGTWYHGAATYDGSTWRLYLDGNLEATLLVGAFSPRSDSVQPFGLGTMQRSPSMPGQLGFFAGLLDEVRVWNHARTQAEIQSSMADQIESAPGLVGRWSLNEGTASTAADSALPAEDGTLQAGAAWGSAAPGIGTATCAHAPIPNCCHSDPECDDADPCTSDACDGVSCEHIAVVGCCSSGADCDDGNVCTDEACIGSVCSNTPNSAPCDDGDACTAGDVCAAGVCAGLPSGSCCDEPSDCDDGNVCTTDACATANPWALALHGSPDHLAMGAAPGLGAAQFTVEAWIYLNGAGGTGASTGSGGLPSALPIVTKGRGEADATNQDMNYFLGIQDGALAADFEEAPGVCVGGSNPGASCTYSCSVATSTRCSLDSQCPAGETCTVVNGCAGGTCDGFAGLNHPVLGTTAVTAAAWHHVAATYDGTCWQLYLDGVADTPGTNCPGRAPRADSIQHFAVGSALTSTGAAAGHLDGIVDEVRVWSVARTQAQILADMGSEILSAPNLIGRWGMNEGSGTTAFDSTTPAENGSFAGAPAWEPGNKPDVGAGTCSHVPVANCCVSEADCDDGDPCTTDACTGNSCTHVPAAGCCDTPADCDDGNVCTDDACVGSACAYTPNSAPCSDGNACTANDACSGGACAGLPDQTLCDDGNACTVDACAGTSPQLGLAFDGTDDHVSVGQAAELGLARFTIETWFKRTGTGVANQTGSGGIAALIPLVAKGAPEADGSNVDANYILGINTAGNVLAADFEQFGTCTGGTGDCTSAPYGPGCNCSTNANCQSNVCANPGLNRPVSGLTAIVSDIWYHAAATYDGTTWRLYLDGNLEATLVVGAVHPRFDSIQHAALGAMLTSAGGRLGAFQGVLDEVRIWSYARSGVEIQSAKAKRITAADGLVARWGLDDGAGNTAADSTIPSSGGTLTNFNLSTAWIAGAPEPSLGAASCSYADEPNGTACADDGNPCTADACNAGACAHPAGNDGATCSDSNTCTTSDTCSAGACSGSYDPSPGCCASNANCDDGNSATTDACDLGTGTCTNALPTSCIAGSSACDDNDACTTDSCVGGNVAALGFTSTASNYVLIGTPAKLGLPQFTIETWFKRTGTGTPNTTGSGGITVVPLVTKGAPQAEASNVDANYILGINTAGNVIAADFEQFGTCTGGTGNCTTPPYGPGCNCSTNANCQSNVCSNAGLNRPVSGVTAIVNGTWYHAAATYDGTTWRLYLNGNLENTLVVGAVSPRYDSIQRAALGTMLPSGAGAPVGFFLGVLDEARVWNRALSQTELQTVMSQELTSGTGLVARWGLNDGGGTTAVDSVATPANGTLTNGPSWSPADKAPIPSGTCLRAPVGVDDGDACTADSCDPATGLIAHSPITCDDGSVCTTDTCDPATGCVFTSNTEPCDDGNACTTGDTCSGTACVGGPAPLCDDGNACTDDGCEPFTGCVHTSDDTNLGPITCGTGVCERTVPGCVGGHEQSCVPGAPTGSDADCNGIDENCSGATDENYVSTPTTCGGLGVCGATGQLVCVAGVVQDTCTPGQPATGMVPVEFGTSMKYRANAGAETVSDWTAPGYDDSSWSSGAFGVGYEASPPGVDNLLLTSVPPETVSVFTRTIFQVTDPAAVQRLLLGADYDDGFVAWINGVEVHGSPEMSRSTEWDATTASHESSNGAVPNYGSLVDISALGLSALRTGENVLAVGVWNSLPDSGSDLVIVPRLSLSEAESCDGLDNDCDGSVDEDYPDLDGDGIRDCVDPDDDGDGVSDATDCAPEDAGSSAGPLSEVANLTWGLHPPVLRWTEQGSGVAYAVISGTIAGLRADGGVAAAACLADDVTFGAFDDARPAPGAAEAYYYLVRSLKESCEGGTYGSASSGAARIPVVACP